MCHEQRLAVRAGVDRPVDGADQIIDVHEHERRGPPADERQDAARGHAEQRQHAAVARTVYDRRTEDRPAQALDCRDHVLAFELAAAVRGDRRRRIALGPRRAGGRRPARRQARDVDDGHARAARAFGDSARAFDVRLDEVPLADGGDAAGQMHDGVGAPQRIGDPRRIERSHDRQHVVALRAQRLDQVTADEAARPRDGDASTHSAFW